MASAEQINTPKQAFWVRNRHYLLLAPGVVWMLLFLVVLLLMMVYVSFWTQTTFAINSTLTTTQIRSANQTMKQPQAKSSARATVGSGITCTGLKICAA